MWGSELTRRNGREDNGTRIRNRFDGIQHNIVYAHTLCQRNVFGSHTLCSSKNAYGAACKDLEQLLFYLVGRKSIAKVGDRGVTVIKSMLLQRDEELGAVDSEGKIDDDADLVAPSFA